MQKAELLGSDFEFELREEGEIDQGNSRVPPQQPPDVRSGAARIFLWEELFNFGGEGRRTSGARTLLSRRSVPLPAPPARALAAPSLPYPPRVPLGCLCPGRARPPRDRVEPFQSGESWREQGGNIDSFEDLFPAAAASGRARRAARLARRAAPLALTRAPASLLPGSNPAGSSCF